MPTILPLSQLRQTDLSLAGGKGANLGELVRGGFNVPNGFCITTEAYRAFIAANALEAEILALAENAHPGEINALEDASAQIRSRFESGIIPDELSSPILEAYSALNPYRPAVPVAVRSSATAEDLPDLSFAGQQDTYLNVLGAEELLLAIRRCWGSLWTARAIGYRARNAISHRQLALAVVVQDMVDSQASGVLFTANPLTGNRLQTVIDATLGLGEALVSGQVEPDQYVVDTPGKRILTKRLGTKALSIRPLTGGGTQKQSEDARGLQALPDEQILELAEIGRLAAAHFKAPQDIEWAWAGEKFYLVQSRPITTLFPLPEGVYPQNRLMVLFSFGSVQGMLDPITPLGRDMFRRLAAGVGRKFGLNVNAETQPTFLSAAERIFVNFTGLVYHPLGRRIFRRVIPAIDPVVAQILLPLLDEPRMEIGKSHVGLKSTLRILRVLAPFGFNVLRNLLSPRRGREILNKKIDHTLAVIEKQVNSTASLGELCQVIREILSQFPLPLLRYLVPGVVAGQAAFQPLVAMAAGLPEGAQLALELTRGLPHNVTTEMDLALWETARAIRSDPASAAHFASTEVNELVRQYQAETLPPAAQQAVSRFLDKYGARGMGEIDIARPRWADDPAPLLRVLAGYLTIPEERSPQAAFARGAEQAWQAQAQLLTALERSPGARRKVLFARWAMPRVRELAGLRESPKFMAMRIFATLRRALMAHEANLIEKGVLDRAGDLFYLQLSEIKALAEGENRDWRAIIARRRQDYDREMQRKQVPRLLLSDGTAYYDTISPDEAAGAASFSGSPVSPGLVEGRVRVVLNPHDAQLVPGEILVCPATDPGWTPLFLLAGGLVMEVGGMMTHGSVVAREYGIPAVVGVALATQRLKTGQRIRLDGSLGQITLLDEAAGE